MIIERIPIEADHPLAKLADGIRGRAMEAEAADSRSAPAPLRCARCGRRFDSAMGDTLSFVAGEWRHTECGDSSRLDHTKQEVTHE